MDTIMTVRGPVPAAEWGPVLPHEHVMCDFIGAAETGRHRYRPDEVCAVMRPYLRAARERGITGFVDCTPAYIGRDPVLLRRLAEDVDLHVVTNTGFYKEPYLPPSAFTESADQLADGWVREYEEGIEGTGIRPGFIKIAVNPGPLIEVQQKIVRAAARAHRRTGLSIASHTAHGGAALEELDLITAEGIDPTRFIVVHTDAEPDRAFHLAIYDRGAWVEYDGIGGRPVEEHVELITWFLRERGPDRLLLSHDAGWYWVGEPNGGTQRDFNTLTDALLPALRARGISDDTLHQLRVLNPARAFAIAG
jgi:predicted metal-dependent phosphotriesterase family hydrolase